jgi:hypothetical protein
MVSLVFDTFHSLWFTRSELSELPRDHRDLELIALNETVDAQKHKLYVYNPKNERLYRPFTHELMMTLEGMEGTDQEFKSLDIDLSSEIGWVNFHVFSKSIVEFPMMILKVVFVTLYERIIDCIQLEFTFAVSSGVCLTIDALLQVVRIIYYGIGILLSSIEGIWFNPARGVLKCDKLFNDLNRSLPLEDGYFTNSSKKRQPKDLDDSMHLWYPDERILCQGSLEDKVICQNTFLEIDRFIKESKIKIDFSEKKIPSLFPLGEYLFYHTQVKVAEAAKQISAESRRVYDLITH